ncbi:DUF11 domain-containing protein [Massilia arenosa]|uniref:DUF11 domain-containing protein n=1 Tax=Zemynaea arenosa TaxID=2561931 RepID=A0A4Y9S755_9BURK|nr:DUF11 domain-containing protein [Massilia arenosa]TFW17327.1 DUF11 domain-containing protein [Massilia arenosa]
MMRISRVLLTVVLMLLAVLARAETPVVLTQSFAGKVNFTGTQKTMRTRSNQSNACAVTASGTDVNATLSGLPSGATVLSAQLYWAGSGSSQDTTVYMDGVAYTAPAARRYYSTINNGGTLFYYFGGAADVTSAVQAKGNGTYKFHGLTVNNSNAYCDVEGILGGFQLLVVYSHPNETFRVLNLYEGFQDFQYNGLTINLANFRTPANLNGATARLGHITWEGDSTLVANGEDLLFNNVEMVDSYNPAHNQFNSSSNITSDNASYGIDFDAYTVGSPTIQGNQTTATTRYQTGQDMVILAAEVIAVPNVPVSDFAMEITAATSAPVLGQTNSFTLVATNNGPSDEPGTVTVVDTIPNTMSITSASGLGWTCNVAGQTVTCTRPGPVAASTALPAITINVTQTGIFGGTITNTASVSGTNFDNLSGNNAASVNLTMTSMAYAFTDKPCVNNKAFGDAQQTCQLKSWSTISAGDSVTPVYITALSNNVPTALGTSSTNRSVYFGLRCNNPTTNAGVKATWTAASGSLYTLPLCMSKTAAASTGAMSAVTLTFAANQPTANVAFAFRYMDVGNVTFSMYDGSANMLVTSGAFVVRPAWIGFSEIKRSSDGALNPAARQLVVPTGTATYTSLTLAFLRAGADTFEVTVAALATDMTTVTPNFGREDTPDSFVITPPESADDPAYGTVNPKPFWEMVGDINNPTPLPALQGGTWQPIVNGASKGTGFTWNGVGIIKLKARNALGNYLETSPEVPSLPSNVGRFVPARFMTSIAPASNLAPYICTIRVACSTNVTGVVYSGQPFNVNVRALLYQAPGDTSPPTLANGYRGRFAEDVTLGPFTTLGAGSAVAGTFTVNAGTTAIVPSTAFATAADQQGGTATALSKYVIPTPAGTPPPTPTPVEFFVRAQRQWTSINSSTILSTSATRNNASGQSEYTALEAGVKAVKGQIRIVGNTGPERLPMPVRFTTEYYMGADKGWYTSDFDSGTTLAPAADIGYTSCQKQLTCPNPVTPTATTAVTVSQGKGNFTLTAPFKVGTTVATVVNSALNAYLASVPGTLVFGIRKSPVIYIREAY